MAFLNWTIVLWTLFINGAELWTSIDQHITAFDDPASPVNGPFTCTNNSVWTQSGIES